MIQIIPITAVPSQSFTVQLDNQQCAINIYQKSTGLFLDLAVDNEPVITAMLCLNAVGLVRQTYLGFIGQLVFYDRQGTSDPDYTGLGTRFMLVYSDVMFAVGTVSPIVLPVPVPSLSVTGESGGITPTPPVNTSNYLLAEDGTPLLDEAGNPLLAE